MKIPFWKIGTVVLAGGILAYVLHRKSQGETPDVKALLTNWKNSICEPNPSSEKISELYDENALLHGTFANTISKGRGQVKDYFDNLLEKPNTCVEIISNKTQIQGNTAINTGIYEFLSGDKENPDREKARYNFVYAKGQDGQWRIINHHSSVIPT